MKLEAKQLFEQLICARLSYMPSSDIADLQERYGDIVLKNNEEAWSQFTTEFGLGDWVHEEALFQNLDLTELLERAYESNFDNEQKAFSDIAEVDRDLQADREL